MELKYQKVEAFVRISITLRVCSDTSLIKAFNSSVTPLNGKKELLHCPSAPYNETYHSIIRLQNIPAFYVRK